MKIKSPTLVVFDLDDTLYRYEKCNEIALHALISKGVIETGISYEEFKSTLIKSRESVKQRIGGTGASHSRLLYIFECLSNLGFANQPMLALNLEQEFWRSYLSEMNLNNGVENLLTYLRFQRIPIALVTDLTLQIQLRKLIKLNIDTFFDVIVASEECKGDKVTLEPFRLLFERCESSWLNHVWFIGDQISDSPINELSEMGLISGGHGWINGANNSEVISGWKSFQELEIQLNKIIESEFVSDNKF